MRVAIMQPYFLPYSGYFRLFYCCDVFVIYDCVQFPRRGWVHRNYFTNHQNEREYLSLPLLKSNRDTTRIMDLVFRDEKGFWNKNVRKFPLIDKAFEIFPDLEDILTDFNKKPIDYIEVLLEYVLKKLNFLPKIIRSSEFLIDPSITGEDRILAICKALDATDYINLAGGIELYEKETFKQQNINLEFLIPHEGSFQNIIENFVIHGVNEVRKEIIQQSHYQ